MSPHRRYRYNPLALRHLMRFLGANLVQLIILCCLLPLGAGLLTKYLPPIPPGLLIGDVSLDNPGQLDWASIKLNILNIEQYDVSFTTNLIKPTIDPDGILSPVISNAATGAARIDLLNLESQQPLFLASFPQGMICLPLLHRPRHNEILVGNFGAQDTFRCRQELAFPMRFALNPPDITTRIHRFAADTGAWLGQLEYPFLIRLGHVSPDGSRLVAFAFGGPYWAGRPRIIHLDSGECEILPFIAYSCYFDTNHTLIVLEPSSIWRYHLTEKRMELLMDFFPNMDHTVWELSSRHDPKNNVVWVSVSVMTSDGEEIWKSASISLDGNADISIIEPHFEGYWYSLEAYISHPKQELYIKQVPVEVQPAQYYWAFFNSRSGEEVKTFPPQVDRLCFLSGDYLWMQISGKNHIVRLDELLDGSFDFTQAEDDR